MQRPVQTSEDAMRRRGSNTAGSSTALRFGRNDELFKPDAELALLLHALQQFRFGRRRRFVAAAEILRQEDL